MTTNIKLIIGAVLALFLVFVGYKLGTPDPVQPYKDAIKEQKKLAEISDSVSEGRNKAVAASVIKKEAKDVQVEKSLQRAPEWADEPVPDSVIDALGM